jgi:predicted metalloprotease
MTVMEDLTVFTAGSEASGEGRIERCPRCGRNGVREVVDGEQKFLHAFSTELMSDGLLVTPEDCCPAEHD